MTLGHIAVCITCEIIYGCLPRNDELCPWVILPCNDIAYSSSCFKLCTMPVYLFHDYWCPAFWGDWAKDVCDKCVFSFKLQLFIVYLSIWGVITVEGFTGFVWTFASSVLQIFSSSIQNRAQFDSGCHCIFILIAQFFILHTSGPGPVLRFLPG